MGKNNKKLTTEEFISRAVKIHGKKYDYSKVKYVNGYTKVEIICPKHGNFFQTPGNHSNYGCLKCGNDRSIVACRSDKETFIEKSKYIHGKKYNYDTVDYINAHTKVKIGCPIHGIFNQSPVCHLNGCGCSRCGIDKKSQCKPKSTEKFVNDAIKIHKNVYDYSKVNYVDAHTKIEIICKKHGSFFQKACGHLIGKGCPKCVHHISKPEVKFLDYLKILNRQKFIQPYKVDGIRGNKVFEFLGDYFHGNPKKHDSDHYNQICHKSFGELYKELNEKFSKLNELGYSIYYMWESDWNSWNKDKTDVFPIKKYSENKI